MHWNHRLYIGEYTIYCILGNIQSMLEPGCNVSRASTHAMFYVVARSAEGAYKYSCAINVSIIRLPNQTFTSKLKCL